MISPRIKIAETTDIQAGDIVYNPIENVSYLVDAYTWHMTYKTYMLYLEPIEPFGSNKVGFSMRIEHAAKNGYELKRNRG